MNRHKPHNVESLLKEMDFLDNLGRKDEDSDTMPETLERASDHLTEAIGLYNLASLQSKTMDKGLENKMTGYVKILTEIRNSTDRLKAVMK